MRRFDPLSFKVSARVVLLISIFAATFTVGMKAQWITFFPFAGLPRSAGSQVWFKAAQVFGLGLPLLFLLFYGKVREVRRVFFPFLFVLGCQVVTELALFRRFFPSVIIPTALLYVSFRVYQLWVGRTVLAQSPCLSQVGARLGLSLVHLNLALWSLILMRLSFRLTQLLAL